MKFYLFERHHLLSYLDDLHDAKQKALESGAAIDKAQINQKKSYEVVNGEAVIPITGGLQRSPDFFSWIFGSSTYDEIAQQTVDAEQDPDVSTIGYFINSPGGEVDGVDTLGQLIKATSKPKTSYVDNMATSAAYWLASQTDKIIATSPTAEFGSIGVIVAGLDIDGIWEKMGAKKILIASTDAPDKKKSYQLDTPDGEKAMIKRLDAVHEVFAKRVAAGRNTTPDIVNEEFGKGGVVSAQEALTKGMIDVIKENISLQSPENDDIKSIQTNERKVVMDKSQLKKDHPEILAEIEKASFDAGHKDGHAKGLEDGMSAEKKRVEDLNVWREKGEKCAEIVDEAIKSGATYSDVQSKLHAALPTQKEIEKEPPAISGDPATQIGGEKKEVTDEEAKTLGKDLANKLGGV